MENFIILIVKNMYVYLITFQKSTPNLSYAHYNVQMTPNYRAQNQNHQ